MTLSRITVAFVAVFLIASGASAQSTGWVEASIKGTQWCGPGSPPASVLKLNKKTADPLYIKVTLFAADATHVLVSFNGAPTDTNAIEVVAPRYRIKGDSWRVVGGDIVLFDPPFTDGVLMFDFSIRKQKIKGTFIQDNVFIEGCASSGKVSAK